MIGGNYPNHLQNSPKGMFHKRTVYTIWISPEPESSKDFFFCKENKSHSDLGLFKCRLKLNQKNIPVITANSLFFVSCVDNSTQKMHIDRWSENRNSHKQASPAWVIILCMFYQKKPFVERIQGFQFCWKNRMKLR